MTYWKDLTKKEKKHLRENRVTTLRAFKACAAGQAASRRKYPTFSEPCWDCRAIAKKLGLEI